MLTNKLLTALFLTAPWASALSVPAIEASPHELLETIQVPNGTLTIYGIRNSPAKPLHADLASAPSCGSNTVTCDYGSHLANVASCDALLNSLRNDPGHGVSESPRDICFGGGGDRCCVSWSKAVGGLNYGMLLPAAEKMRNTCVNANSNRVSAKSDDTQLRGSCVKECLSDRPSGC